MKSLRLLLITLFAVLAVQNAEAQRRRVVVRNSRHSTRVYHRVVVRKAHLRYGNMPRWGAVATVAPPRAVLVGPRAHRYYFVDGIYYAHRNNNYVIVRPVRGLRLTVLPAGYRTIVLGPRQYYYYYGTFYAMRSPGAYEVIDPPMHAVVDALPDGYEVVEKDGNQYYLLDGVYYAEVDAPEFEDGVGYEVVG